MTQPVAYKIIRQRKMNTIAYENALARPNTIRNLKLAKCAATNMAKNAPTTDKIWNSLKNKDISRNIHFFLWMLTYDAYKVGHYWPLGKDSWKRTPRKM
jgi:hypothetical protein